MMQREDGRVKIDISEDDFTTLLLALGFATGSSRGSGDELSNRFIRLDNSINEGNPQWIPYEVTEPQKGPQ